MPIFVRIHKHFRILYTETNTLAALVCLVLCFFLTACGGRSVVELTYPLSPPAASDTRPNFCVVDFENMRTSHNLGTYRDGEVIRPRTPVERWLASAVAGELANKGFTAITVENFKQALDVRADYIITGDAEEIRIDHPSITRFASTLRMTLVLMDGRGRHVTANNYNGVFSQTVLPGTNVPRSLLSAALQEVLQPAVRHIIQTVQSR